MIFKLLLPVILLATIMTSACNSRDKEALPNDPYGLIEAQETGEATDRLMACSQNEDCPEYAQALFWVAVVLLTEAPVTIIPGAEEDHALAEPTDRHPTGYDFDSHEFQLGYKTMKKAHLAGRIYAANALGVIHMDYLPIKDFDLARSYFEVALERGDIITAYNLARLTRMETPHEYRTIIAYLRQASTGENPDLKIIYTLALEAFGTDNEKHRATRYLKKKKVGQYGVRSQFKESFNLKEHVK